MVEFYNVNDLRRSTAALMLARAEEDRDVVTVRPIFHGRRSPSTLFLPSVPAVFGGS